MINPISNMNQQNSAVAKLNATQKENKTADVERTSAEIAKATGGANNLSTSDKFVKDSNKTDAGIYKKPENSKMTADQINQLSEQRISQFNKMLEGMIGTQVSHVNKAMFNGLNVTATQKADAQKAIAPGGEWSPDAVSGRILDMAKALSGGDASKFELLKNAVKKGFGAAEKQWGSKLPDITNQTYDKVMAGFDQWEKDLNAGATQVEA